MHVRGSAEVLDLLPDLFQRFQASSGQHDRGAVFRELLGDGAANPAARARDHYVHTPAAAAVRSLSTALESATCTTLMPSSCGRRFIIGASTSLAPHSMMISGRTATRAVAVSCQRTRAHTLANRQRRISSIDVYGCALTLLITVKAGIRNCADSTAREKRGIAGCINSLCQAPETLSTRTRLAPSSLAIRQAASTLAVSPETTICSGMLRLPISTRPPVSARARAQTSSTLFSGRPMIAAIVPGVISAAWPIDWPRSLTIRTASEKSSAPAMVSEQYSPNE